MEYSMHGTDEKCIQVLVGKPERRRPLRRLRHTLEDNIKMDLEEGGCVVDSSGPG
jgi:hypothetical protein